MKPANSGIERVAVIGAGTIGASWAAYFLARGLSVTASDPAPNGEDFVRRAVNAGWPDLIRLGLAPGGSPERLVFVRESLAAAGGPEFVQGGGPQAAAASIAPFAALDGRLGPEGGSAS